MKKIRIAYAILIGGLTILWLMADPTLIGEYEFVTLRKSLINFTGIIAIGAMSVTMVLALRRAGIEPLLGGLDKAYRLHKWLGITGLVFSILHFLLANMPKLLLEPEALEAPPPALTGDALPGFLQFFEAQAGLAEEFGDWGFKIAVILIAIALIRWFPYRFFFRSHRLLALVYLFLAFHSIALMDFLYWRHVIAPVMVILLIAGSVAAIVSLLGKVGAAHRAVGEIETFEYLENNSVLKVAVRLKSRWPGHEEGQFAFVTFDRHEGAHPFSIASTWTGDGFIGFFIKGLGDYTQALPTALKKGDLATVEGPYGRFGFDAGKPRQIWVAGGIGIAPFAARLKALGKEAHGGVIDFFYSASEADDEKFLMRISEAADKANVRVHILRSATDGRLDADRVCETVPDWQEAEVWFCGPAGFGDSLREGMVAKGLSVDSFHQELFEMR